MTPIVEILPDKPGLVDRALEVVVAQIKAALNPVRLIDCEEIYYATRTTIPDAMAAPVKHHLYF